LLADFKLKCPPTQGIEPFKDEAQTALFKDTFRTAQATFFISVIKNQSVMLYGAQDAVYLRLVKKHIQCGQKVQLFMLNLLVHHGTNRL
jgi:hypothetical protein